jgi:hypothetical protein
LRESLFIRFLVIIAYQGRPCHKKRHRNLAKAVL